MSVSEESLSSFLTGGYSRLWRGRGTGCKTQKRAVHGVFPGLDRLVEHLLLPRGHSRLQIRSRLSPLDVSSIFLILASSKEASIV
jgi:hypothetical protein